MPYYCQICEVEVSNSDKCIQMHLNGRRHAENSRQTGGCDEDECNDDAQQYYCTDCDVFVPNNDKCLQQHLKGRRHKDNLRPNGSFDDDDDEKLRAPGNTLCDSNFKNDKQLVQLNYCSTCDVNLPNNSKCIKQHLNGKNHLNNLQHINDYCDDDDELVNSDNQPINTLKEQNLKKPKKLAKSRNKTVSNDDTFYCTTCDMLCSKSELRFHIYEHACAEYEDIERQRSLSKYYHSQRTSKSSTSKWTWFMVTGVAILIASRYFSLRR